MLDLNYLFLDKDLPTVGALSDYDTLDFVSNGKHIYGEILWPDGSFKEKRPCVIMFHGFPGSARNDDISHALCRIGCVVLVPHHRGAWGSEGKYLVSNCIEDAKNLGAYVQSEEFINKYNVDKKSIFFLGHSMGANTALNAGKSLSWLSGIIMITPFDPARYLAPEKRFAWEALLKQGKVLQSDGGNAILQDVLNHKEEFSFPNAFDSVKDMNLLCLSGIYDTCAPIEDMVKPLFDKLFAYKSKALQRSLTYPAEHGLLGCRIKVIQEIAKFVYECTSL